jgi:hypothetical protein
MRYTEQTRRELPRRFRLCHMTDLSPPAKSPAERKRAQRQRLRAAGFKQYSIFLKPAEWQAVKRFIERLRARK